MAASLGAVLARPAWWALALAAFLVRGGFALVLLPFVTAPSAAAIATFVAPTVNRVVFGELSIAAILTSLAIIGSLLAVVVAALGLGSWIDLALLGEASRDDELEARSTVVPMSAWRALTLRLLAHVPTLVAAGYALVRLVMETYSELLSPGDPSLPVTVRVLGRAPDAAAVLVVAWMLGEAAGGIAVRRAAAGATIRPSIRAAIAGLLRLRGVATLAVTTGAVVVVLVPLVLAVLRSVESLRVVLVGGGGTIEIAITLLILVATWILGLALLGVALAWRQVAWTAELLPEDPSGPGPEAARSPA